MMRFLDEEDKKKVLDDLGASTKDLILMPVNDNNDYNMVAGGTHWR
jgi:hypothetical protein